MMGGNVDVLNIGAAENQLTLEMFSYPGPQFFLKAQIWNRCYNNTKYPRTSRFFETDDVDV
jgi:hypothetical protein